MVAWETVIAPKAHFHVWYMRALQGPLFPARSSRFLPSFLFFFIATEVVTKSSSQHSAHLWSLSLSLLSFFFPRTCKSARNISILLVTSISRKDGLAHYGPKSLGALPLRELLIARWCYATNLNDEYLSISDFGFHPVLTFRRVFIRASVRLTLNSSLNSHKKTHWDSQSPVWSLYKKRN